MKNKALFEAIGYVEFQYLEKVENAAKQNGRKNARSVKVGKRIVILAAVVAGMLAVGTVAYAVGNFIRHRHPEPVIEAAFGDSQGAQGGGQVEIRDHLEKMVYAVTWPRWERVPVDDTLADELVAPYVAAMGQTMEYNGYKVIMEAMLHDAKTGAGILYYSVENPKGISGYQIETSGEIWWPPESKINIDATYIARHYIDEAQSTATKLYVVGYYVVDEEHLSVFPTLDFFMTGSDRTERACQLSLEFCDGGLMVGDELADGGILLSPIAMKLNGEMLNLNMHAAPPDISLIYEDGSEYVILCNGENLNNSGWLGYHNGMQNMTIVFNRIVDTDRVISVAVAGVEYSMTS